MAKISKTKYALLGVLNETPASGYDIKKFCDSSISFFWNENYGHIYPLLQKMNEEKLVTKQTKQAEGKPTKNMYFITEKGAEELEKWLKLPIESQPIRSELLLKIFMSKDIPVNFIIDNIITFKENLEKKYNEFLKIEDSLKNNKSIDKKKLTLWLLTVKNGQEVVKAELKWCEDSLKLLKEINNL